MIKKILCLTLVISISFISYSQKASVPKTASVLNLKRDLGYLASDELRGRKTGTPDADKAADYISKRFKEYGLETLETGNKENPFFHPFNILSLPFSNSCKLKIADTKQVLYNYSDLIIFTGSSFGNTALRAYIGDIDSLKSKVSYAKTVFANSLDEGIKKVDEQIKTNSIKSFLVVLPAKKLIDVCKQRNVLSGNSITSVNSSGDTLLSAMFSNPILLKDNAVYSAVLPFLSKNKEVKLLVTDEYLAKKLFSKEQISGYPEVTTPAIGKAIQVDGIAEQDKITKSNNSNVVGYIKGTTKSDEYILVTSHYDHIGVNPPFSMNGQASKDSICNGADDNASGTSAVMEVSRLFGELKSKGIRPKKSVVFISFSGEEEGLLGSQYLAENPIIPNSKIVSVVNLDMVGRSNEVHTNKDMYVYVLSLGDSTLFTQPVAIAKKKAAITIPASIPDKERQMWTMGSDHYSFYKKGIPALVLTTGEHPDYHTPADEVSKIVFDRLTKIVDFTYYTVWEMAK